MTKKLNAVPDVTVPVIVLVTNNDGEVPPLRLLLETVISGCVVEAKYPQK